MSESWIQDDLQIDWSPLTIADRYAAYLGVELPAGTDHWALKATRRNGSTRQDFHWPDSGVATAPGPIREENKDSCPYSYGDGICLALAFFAMSTAGHHPANRMLLVAYADADVLGGNPSKIRVRTCTVVSPVQVRDADLRRANLRWANLAGVDLSGKDLTGANLEEADLFESDLDGANLTDTDLTATRLTRATLVKANLTRARMVRAVAFNSNLTGANLTDTNLSGAVMVGSNLTDVIVSSNTDLTLAHLTDVRFTGVDTSQAVTNYANME